MVLDNTARTVSKLEVTMGKIDNVLSDSYENLNSGMRSTLSGTAQLLENLHSGTAEDPEHQGQ